MARPPLVRSAGVPYRLEVMLKLGTMSSRARMPMTTRRVMMSLSFCPTRLCCLLSASHLGLNHASGACAAAAAAVHLRGSRATEEAQGGARRIHLDLDQLLMEVAGGLHACSSGVGWLSKAYQFATGWVFAMPSSSSILQFSL